MRNSRVILVAAVVVVLVIAGAVFYRWYHMYDGPLDPTDNPEYQQTHSETVNLVMSSRLTPRDAMTLCASGDPLRDLRHYGARIVVELAAYDALKTACPLRRTIEKWPY